MKQTTLDGALGFRSSQRWIFLLINESFSSFVEFFATRLSNSWSLHKLDSKLDSLIC